MVVESLDHVVEVVESVWGTVFLNMVEGVEKP
jgi:hypothetical protein